MLCDLLSRMLLPAFYVCIARSVCERLERLALLMADKSKGQPSYQIDDLRGEEPEKVKIYLLFALCTSSRWKVGGSAADKAQPEALPEFHHQSLLRQ